MSKHNAEILKRVDTLERQVDVLTRALHLLTVSAGPTSKWLDAEMASIPRPGDDA